MNRTITLAEAAKIARGADGKPLAQVSLRAAAERGALKARKEGRNWKTTTNDLSRYLKNRPKWWKPRR